MPAAEKIHGWRGRIYQLTDSNTATNSACYRQLTLTSTPATVKLVLFPKLSSVDVRFIYLRVGCRLFKLIYAVLHKNPQPIQRRFSTVNRWLIFSSLGKRHQKFHPSKSWRIF